MSVARGRQLVPGPLPFVERHLACPSLESRRAARYGVSHMAVFRLRKRTRQRQLVEQLA
jgi:hypothetical protein